MKKQRKLLLFYLTLILVNMGLNIAHPATPAFLKSLNLGDYVFGLAYATMAFFNFSTSLTWGSFSSRYRISTLLLISSVIYGLAQFLFGTATSVIAIVFARALAGISASSFSILPINYLISVSSRHERLSNITIASVLTAVSASLGYLLGGLLAEVSLLFVFIIQTLWMVMVGIVFYFVLNQKQTLTKSSLRFEDFNPFRIFSKARKILNPTAVRFFWIVFIVWIAATIFDSSFNYYIKDVFDFPPKVNGYIKALIGILALLINSFLTLRLLKKFKLTTVNRILYALLVVSSMLVLWVVKPQLFIFVSFIYFMFNSMVLPIQQNTVSALYEDASEISLSMGYFNAVKMLGSVVGSLSAGFLYELRPIYPFVLTTVLFSFVLLLTMDRLD